MATKLQNLLPPPAAVAAEDESGDPWFEKHADKNASSSALVSAVREPPPYGKRTGWAPRDESDFGDGGAFPEIVQAQYPLGLGRSTKRQGTNGTLALQVDKDGKMAYDAIAKVGQTYKNKVVYSRLEHQKGMYLTEDDESLRKPDDDAIIAETEKTRAALEKITKCKVAAALPTRLAEKQAATQFVRYTPSQQGEGFAGGSQQRIIRMVEEQKDPMEPPRFKINGKLPRAPPSPPAPVMHSPTRKVTAKEQADWKIPPCLSNWKNIKGFTVALDKRLAADGRGLQQVHINENFAKFSEALYIADRKARESVELRSQLEKRQALKKKEEQEEKMKEMARAAREERQNIRRTVPTADEEEEKKNRDDIRHDRQADRRRDRNLARAAPTKQAKLRADKDRDISEKIALGLADPRAGRGNDGQTLFDDRLFNQTKGLDSGGIDDETFAVYDKPWRQTDGLGSKIYRPTKNADNDIYGGDLDKVINTNRFVPDKGFAGTDAGATKGGRDGPVQFEKNDEVEDDPFGLSQLLDAAKSSKRGAKDSGKERGDEKRSRR